MSAPFVGGALAAVLFLTACASHRPPLARAAATCARRVPGDCPGPPPGFATDVAPILEARCFRCHTGDGDAAEDHDFSRAESVRAQRAGIAKQLSACAMPPRRAPPLADQEADTLLRWIACGAPLP